MYGDFSRLTFNARRRDSRVLMQQGRPFLDADWNEQVAILIHAVRRLARTLIGPHGGSGDSLKLGTSQDQGGAARRRDFEIAGGEYYVDGILCELAEPLRYADQPLVAVDALEDGRVYLAYLDVWERHVSAIQDDRIREIALGGFDTATRARVSLGLRVADALPGGGDIPPGTTSQEVNDAWADWVAALRPGNRGRLKARALLDPEQANEPCLTAPEARYRGPENQLYRVEIHQGGPAGEATFKWSRDNGSVEFLVRELAGLQVTLEGLGRDQRRSLTTDVWVEVLDDNLLRAGGGPLLQVADLDEVDSVVHLQPRDGVALPAHDQTSTRHPLLRRWDQTAGEPARGGLELVDGAALLVEGDGDIGWLTLEHGIQIQFQADGAVYQPGDYWLIPARIASGDVEWPGPAGAPEAVPPHGVEHHLAPLAIVSLDGAGVVTVGADCRRLIEPLATIVP